MRATAVYYPYFVPSEAKWLASALLWWEEIYLIWPQGVGTWNPVVQELMRLQAIRTIDPSQQVISWAPEFVEQVLKPNIDSIAKAAPSFSQSIYLHSAKLGPLTDSLDSVAREIGKRYAVGSGGDIRLDKRIEVPYMSFLADKLAENPAGDWSIPSADTVTDDEHYLRYFGKVRTVPDAELRTDRVEADKAVLVTLRDVALELEDFSVHAVEDLAKFRDEYRKERKRLRSHMAELVANIKLASQLRGDEGVDLVEETSRTLKRGLFDLEKQIRGYRLRARICDLGAVLAGITSLPSGPLIAGAVTVGGITVSEWTTEHQVQEILEQSPLTYLFRAKRMLGRRGLVARVRHWMQRRG